MYILKKFIMLLLVFVHYELELNKLWIEWHINAPLGKLKGLSQEYSRQQKDNPINLFVKKRVLISLLIQKIVVVY